MDNLRTPSRVNKTYLYMGFVWILSWVISWGKIIVFQNNLYSIFIVDMIKLGVALGMFILPGALLYVILAEREDNSLFKPDILPVGFALSTAIVGVIGIIGRIFGFSFDLVKGIFAFVGLGELVILAFFKPNSTEGKFRRSDYFRDIFGNVLLILALVLAVSMTFNGYQFFIDDTTYAAYLTNWQHSTRLGFDNIVHHTGIIEDERFWLALYPMGQALLADLSGVPGILLFSNYIELFLVPLAVITAYCFARILELSRKAAGLSAFVQVLLYTMMIDESWPVGFWFFQNMAEDKVSAVFLLSPVWFAFALKFLQRSGKNNAALFFIAGAGIALTHPVILFLSSVVVMGLAIFSWVAKRTVWQRVTQLALMLALLMAPYAVMRLYEHPSQALIPFDAESVSETFQAERYVNVVSDLFYGLNPEVLKLIDISPDNSFYSAYQIFRLIPVFLAFTAAALSFRKIKEGALQWYIVTCVLLVIVAAVPYTGWILGLFISARMISRVSWFSPLGLAGALVIVLVSERLKTGSIFKKPVKSPAPETGRSDEAVKGVLAGLMLTGILMVFLVLPRAPHYFEVLDHNRQLAQIGSYIDRNTSGATTVIAVDYSDIQMLPGVSAHTSLISFREEKEYNPHNYFLSVEEIHERMKDSNTIRSLDPSVSVQERCDLINGYDVEFVVARQNDASTYADLVNTCEKKIEYAFETKDMVLLEFR